MIGLLAAAPVLLAAATPTGGAAASVRTAVLDHAVTRGDVLAPEDFTITPLPAANARAALSAKEAAGMEARRNLAAGVAVRSGDVMPRQLVRRGEPVTIRFVSGSLTIAATGKALGSGAKGELVRVVTASTSRTIDGVVDGSGSVRIAAP